jgi:hypothetical protein
LTEEVDKAYTAKGKEMKDYEPVLYEIVKDPSAASKDREGLTSIQEGFLERSERLL